MNGRDRLLVTIGIIAIIAIALFTSFGRSLFSRNIPSVTLPDLSLSSDSVNDSTSWVGNGDTSIPVTVTVDTVQDVVASLQRTDSYSQELTVELFWGVSSSLTQVSVWRNGDWIATQQTLPSGVVRHDLVGDITRYYWYDDEKTYLSAPVDQNSADLSQRIPTYEDIALVATSDILSASFESYEEIPSVYVETATANGVLRYWISTSTGLLVAAEAEESGVLVYRLTATSPIRTPCPTTAPLYLPDGTTIENLD